MGKVKEKVYSFFWWFSGARKDILLKHKNDHEKYFQIGLAVFITMCLAMITGSIAANIAIVGYENAAKGEFSWLAILFGIFWGLAIMGIDRTIVVTMQKREDTTKEEGLAKYWNFFKTEFLPAIPRIFLAFLIAKIVIDPFELMLYSKEIAHQLELDKRTQALKDIETVQEQLKKTNEMISKNSELKAKEKEKRLQEYNQQIATLEKELHQLQHPFEKEINSCWAEYQSLDKEYHHYRLVEMEEAKTGKGPNWRDARDKKNFFKTKRDQKQRECDQLEQKEAQKAKENQPLIEDVLKKIAKLKDKIIELNTKVIPTKPLISLEENSSLLPTISQGFSSYNQALEAKERLFEKNERYRRIHYLYMAFIFTLEVLPIFTKILSGRGGYEAEIQKLTEESSLYWDKERELVRLKTQFELREETLKREYQMRSIEERYARLQEKIDEPLFKEKQMVSQEQEKNKDTLEG